MANFEIKADVRLLADYEKELGKQLKLALTKAGYKVPRQLSIRKGRGGYETSYTITIKDLTVSRKEVEEIVEKFEDISYDERSYEILQGGNTYIFVEYDYNTVSKTENQWEDTLEQLRQKVQGRSIKIKTIKVVIPSGADDDEAWVCKGSEKKRCLGNRNLMLTLLQNDVTENDVIRAIK